MTQMSFLFIKQKQTYTENRFVVDEGEGVGEERVESLGLADASVMYRMDKQ